MATVRISGNWRIRSQKEWAGAPDIDRDGHIDRSLPIPEEAYLAIEGDIRQGAIQGLVTLKDGTELSWFLDR